MYNIKNLNIPELLSVTGVCAPHQLVSQSAEKIVSGGCDCLQPCG
jgi:hypothetical protein